MRRRFYQVLRAPEFGGRLMNVPTHRLYAGEPHSGHEEGEETLVSKDFRIHAFAFENLKIRKLRKRHGDDGLLALFTLWSYSAQHKPDGMLNVADAEDVEMMSEWGGEGGALCRSLKECGLLDLSPDGTYSIHDWAEHNPFVATGTGKQSRLAIDFRVATGFRGHVKIKQLYEAHGAAGVVSLVRLWSFAAVNRTNGILTGLDCFDVAQAAGWEGDDEKFVDTLIRLGLVDSLVAGFSEHQIGPEGPFRIHNWEKWNAWRFHSQERSDHARRAASKRWQRSAQEPVGPAGPIN